MRLINNAGKKTESDNSVNEKNDYQENTKEARENQKRFFIRKIRPISHHLTYFIKIIELPSN